MKRLLLRLIVRPDRVRKLIARTVSAFMQWAADTRAWDAVSALPRWLRRLADFIDGWNAAELPADKDRLISELVRYAITDEAVDRLMETVVGLEAHSYPEGSRLLDRSELIKALKDAR